MWEIGVFKRIVPAFVIVLMAVILYIISKYAINGLMDAFGTASINGTLSATAPPMHNPTTADTAGWALAWWIFGLMGVFIVWFYLMKAWEVVKGHMPSGMDEPRKRGPKPKSEVDQGPGFPI